MLTRFGGGGESQSPREKKWGFQTSKNIAPEKRRPHIPLPRNSPRSASGMGPPRKDLGPPGKEMGISNIEKHRSRENNAPIWGSREKIWEITKTRFPKSCVIQNCAFPKSCGIGNRAFQQNVAKSLMFGRYIFFTEVCRWAPAKWPEEANREPPFLH